MGQDTSDIQAKVAQAVSQAADDDIYDRFSYHAPSEDRAILHDTVREELMATARILLPLLPDGREKSLFLTKLEEAMFWANAAIARQEPAD